MKVKKEQFLLPKAKTNSSSTNTKWIQPARKTCEFPKAITSVSSQPILEGLPTGLVTKIKPTGDIIVSGHSGGQFIWKQQNGILRQALMNNEKDVKCEEMSGESVNIECGQNLTHVETCVVPSVTTPGTSLLAITAVPPQQLTPIATSQVVNVNDYQVILSSDTFTTTWQDKRRRNNQKLTSLPPIKPKLGPGQVTFASLGNINILGQNQKQFSTIVIKDGKCSVPNNITKNVVAGNPVIHQNSLPKRGTNKITKNFKVRKKPVNTRKIMLKPASSLLTQTALDYKNEDYIESQSDNIESQTTNLPMENSSNTATDCIIKTIAEPVALITANFPNVTKKITNLLHTKSSENNDTNTERASKSKEKEIIFNTHNINEVDFPATNNTVEIYSEPNVSGQTVILHSNELQKTDVNTEQSVNINILNSATQIHQNNELKENISHVESLIDLTQDEDFHRNHIEAIILPSDMEHHEEHHTQEYTENLLSQLSDSGALPNISSSQVSSVLNALVSSEKSVMNTLSAAEKSTKEAVKCEPMEFVKIENLHVLNSIKTKNKPVEPKYRICELNKNTCFRCISCMYLSLKAENVERHWVDQHKTFRPRCSEKQSKRQIKCIGCSNIFYSKYALQIHLLCDHNITTTEVHDLVAMILSANRSQIESKRQSALKSTHLKTNEDAQESETVEIVEDNVQSSLQPDPAYHADESMTIINAECLASDHEPDLLIEPTAILSQPTKADEQKLPSDQEQKTPPTPTFGLFSEVIELQKVQNQKDKAEPSSQETVINTLENERKKIISFKRVTKNIRRYKTTRNKMRPDVASEIKFNYKCVVERCGVRVSSMENLTYHFRCHQTDSDMLFCPECDFSVFLWNSLTPHLWRQHNIDIDLYSCKHCNYKSNSYSKLINNHIKIHSDERPFLCDICGKGFKTTKQLRNHKGIHRARRKFNCSNRIPGENEDIELNGSLSEHTCNICSRSFADSRILKHHTEIVHNKTRPYLCTFCSHTASSKSSLQMHIRQHTGEKPFSCDECAYVTSDHNSLRRHKMRHSGKRPYQCPHCTYSCIQSTTYKSHLKNKHPGLDEGLMFSCPMCPFRTVKKDNYLAHKAEHDLGGDPRSRRKKAQLPLETVQDHSTSSVCKTITYLPEQQEVLLNHTTSIDSVEDHEIELILPEANEVQV